MTNAYEGTININESSIDKETVKEFQKHIGIVFQQHNLFPHLSVLDPILTGEVLDSILELKSLGKDFIFLTHEINFVRKFADYFIFMDEGKIVEEGNISELNNPKTEKLQLFLKRVI
jgi:ABC-type polar amino acid transport system ATPase subunit